MIKSLKLNNFIIVKELQLQFEKGLQVLTGETGAGKSIIAGAVNIIFGAQIRSGMLFDESKSAYLEVVFDVDKTNVELIDLLHKYDVDMSEDEFFFVKEINTELKGKTFLNGRRISNSSVKEFREILLDFHSQRDQQKLFNQDYQLEILDKFGNLIQQRENFKNKFKNIEMSIKELSKLEKQESELSEKMKLYEYQVQEIEGMDIKVGEDDALQSEFILLTNAEEILNQASNMEQVIYEQEDSVYDTINSFIGKLSEFEENEPHLKKAISSLHNSLADLDESISEIRQVQNTIVIDSSRLEEVQERLNNVNSICTKYKRTIKEILEYSERINKEISNYSSGKDRIQKLRKELNSGLSKLRFLADELSEKRKKAALKFEEEIENNIKKMAIPDARVQIRFDKVTVKKDFTAMLDGLLNTGKDEIDIYFSANKGVSLQPIRFAASGGELSRFLLTIKKILSDRLDSRTIVFDEIDSGIGGRTSELLAEFIHSIGRFHQVICISHLPQIASFADKHFSIVKKSCENTSEILVNVLKESEKREEIARMLSGSNTELALRHADELIKKVKGE
ncbi:MAG: DNA repair protein RecN [Candidatus Cloacimonetes bacterium]|nr:DNA repair protein RecN [Candidatus Cloacimonadota bacterium]